MIDRQAAWCLLTEFTQSESLRKHALAVEACMRACARKLAGGASHQYSASHQDSAGLYQGAPSGVPQCAFQLRLQALGVRSAKGSQVN